MKSVSIAIFLLVGIVGYAVADDDTAVASESATPVEQYTYSTDLDIAKVVSVSSIPQVCEVVPAQMVYEDSHGKQHILEYRVMGDGCKN